MATSLGANRYNRQAWEDSEFPILCETCLGENPYVRMMKDKFGQECKICERPFTIFRWCPGRGMRYKKTEVCQTCARLKNVCQTCLFDLEYGLPVQVRDAGLEVTENVPQSEVNKEYFSNNIQRQIATSDPTKAFGEYGKAKPPSDMLAKLARTTPYYKRNRPHICSFWVKGECKRGEECPYRHEKPSDPDDPLSDQNIKDRYYGVNDPVAEKLMKRYDDLPKLVPPEDKTVTTLYVGGITDDISDRDLRNYFYQFGEIRNIVLVPKSMCAFIQYTTRDASERAAEACFSRLVIKGKRLNVKWGKPQALASSSLKGDEAGSSRALDPVPGLPGALPEPPRELANDYFGISQSHMFPSGSDSSSMLPRPSLAPPVRGQLSRPPPGLRPPGMVASAPPSGPKPIHYPSQDPTRMGAIQKRE